MLAHVEVCVSLFGGVEVSVWGILDWSFKLVFSLRVYGSACAFSGA